MRINKFLDEDFVTLNEILLYTDQMHPELGLKALIDPKWDLKIGYGNNSKMKGA